MGGIGRGCQPNHDVYFAGGCIDFACLQALWNGNQSTRLTKDTNLDLILTNYPLSRDYQERLTAIVAPEVLKLSVGELRQRPFGQMVNYMRTLKVERVLFSSNLSCAD